ncbi:MAG TPA: ABC transporter permease [Streptosporangiaceae bacterium]|nr:ABC transporter permease [Streptosporangiaceae bacterium]
MGRTVGCYPRRGAVPARLARDNAAGNPRRTAASAAVLVVGVSIAAAISVIAASARASAQDAVGGSHADIYLQGSGITGRLTREVAAQPGVRAVTPLADPLVDVGGNRTRIVGINPASVPYLINIGVRSGDLSTLHGQRLFVFAGEAAAHGWAVGSHVTVDFGQGPRTLTVAGTYSDRRFLSDDYLMGIGTLFRDMPDQQSQAAALLVRADPRMSALALKSAIMPLLSATPGVSVQTAVQYARAQAADLGDISHVLGLLTALAVLTDLIAFLGIASTLTLSLTERTRELGVVRALGLTRRQLTEMITIESVITCLLGALPGTALGLAGGAALAAVLTSNQTGVATVRLPPGQLLTLLAVACVTGLLASIIPATYVARLPILPASAD